MKCTRVSQNGHDFCGRRMELLLVVVVIGFAAQVCGSELLFGQLWRAELTIMKREQVAHDAVVELEGALEFRKRLAVRGEARDDVIALLLAADGICQLAPAPMVDLQIGGSAEKGMKTLEAFVDGGIFECRVEDVHRLVLPRHGRTSLWTFLPPTGSGGRRVNVESVTIAVSIVYWKRWGVGALGRWGVGALGRWGHAPTLPRSNAPRTANHWR